MYKGLMVIAAAFFIATASYGRFGDVVSSFPVPAKTGTRGLAWDGNHLWLSGKPYNYMVRTTTRGSVVSSFKATEIYPSDIEALTFDGEYLWYSVYRVPGGYWYNRVTTTGSQIKIFGAGYGDPGLAWEPPRYLWIGPFKVTTTGSLVASFNPPFYLGGDLAWYGHYLWTNSGGPEHFTYELTTKGSILASFPTPGGSNAGGTAFDGNYLWLINPTAGYVYQVDIGVVGVDPGSMGKIKGLYR